VCDGKLNSTDSVNRFGEASNNAFEKFFHSGCYDLISRECVCPLCKSTFNIEELRQIGALNCSECGHVSSAIECDKCGGVLVRNIKDYSVYAHPTCCKILEAQKAQLIEERRRNRDCTSCGKDLGLLDLLFKREKHHGCHGFRRYVYKDGS
jgi:RecJ-like exonuclease